MTSYLYQNRYIFTMKIHVKNFHESSGQTASSIDYHIILKMDNLRQIQLDSQAKSNLHNLDEKE